MGVGVQGSLLSAIPKIMLFGVSSTPADGRLYVNYDATNKIDELDMTTLLVIRTVTSYHNITSIRGCGANSSNIYFFNGSNVGGVRLSDGVQLFSVPNQDWINGYFVESIHADENYVYIVRVKNSSYDINVSRYHPTTGAFIDTTEYTRTDSNRIQNMTTLANGRTFYRYDGYTYEVNTATFNLIKTVVSTTYFLSGGKGYLYTKTASNNFGTIDPATLLVIQTTSATFPTGATRMAIQKIL
jgi:hypothetical protein